MGTSMILRPRNSWATIYIKKGVQRGECPSLEAGLVLCHAPGHLETWPSKQVQPESMQCQGDTYLRKKTRGSKKQNCNCSACEKKIQSGELPKEKKSKMRSQGKDDQTFYDGMFVNTDIPKSRAGDNDIFTIRNQSIMREHKSAARNLVQLKSSTYLQGWHIRDNVMHVMYSCA